MYKKIIPIVTIVIAIGLFAFIWGVQKEENKKAMQHEKLYEQRRPLTVKQEQLQQEIETLEKNYEKSKSPNAVVQVIFTELNEQVYSQCYPIMKEYEYTGTLLLSDTQLPGQEGCMSMEQFQELMDAGWQVAVTWKQGVAAKQWWTNLQNRLTVLGIKNEPVLYFPKGTYDAELDTTIQELGFSIAVVNKGEEEQPLQLQNEEGVWHVGAVGMMTSKPRLWLREAVAQDANLAYLIGFTIEEELYNEKSFRSMLNCFDEYEATDELVTTNIVEAREHFRSRSAGVAPEIESQYQEKKTALEKELAEVKKKLEKIDAKY